MSKAIKIYDENGKRTRVIFQAPENKYVARMLWVFLVENLQPGFIVELGSTNAEITRPSGTKVPSNLFKALIDMPINPDT